jgi:hypothetical protein
MFNPINRDAPSFLWLTRGGFSETTSGRDEHGVRPHGRRVTSELMNHRKKPGANTPDSSLHAGNYVRLASTMKRIAPLVKARSNP